MRKVFKMKSEYTAEDLKGAIRNPFYKKLVKEVVVPVRQEDYAVFEKIAEINGETPEMLMKRCLKICAKEFQEDE
jgi:hypothetical protein